MIRRHMEELKLVLNKVTVNDHCLLYNTLQIDLLGIRKPTTHQWHSIRGNFGFLVLPKDTSTHLLQGLGSDNNPLYPLNHSHHVS